MASLVEAAAAVGISGMVMLLATTSLTGIARIQAVSAVLASEMFAARQLEQLVDRAVLQAGNGPLHPPAVSAVSADTVVFGADTNGDGVVDTSSSETTALETRRDGADARVRVRLGRQTMTVLEADHRTASLVARNVYGQPAGAASTTSITLVIEAAGDPRQERQLLFSVPARVWR